MVLRRLTLIVTLTVSVTAVARPQWSLEEYAITCSYKDSLCGGGC